MEKRNTKHKIMMESLTLFSVKGFDGVTVKDIADAVGIKDSSLYKHYRSKKEIFNCLLDEMQDKFGKAVAFSSLPKGEPESIADEFGQISVEKLQEATRDIFLFFLNDPYASKFRWLLTIEQYRNKWARETYQSFFITNALEYLIAVFGSMMELGYMEKESPKVLAMQFYAPVFLLLSFYDDRPGEEEEALKEIDCHIRQFMSHFMKRQKYERQV